jgi:hypothetical protein
MFLTLMVIGLAGLVAMALPALGRHGALGHGHGHGHALHGGGGGGGSGGGGGLARLAPGRGALTAASTALVPKSSLGTVTRFLPSPRAVFSSLALYGAFGNVMLAAHLALLWAALAALVPTILVERFAVTPLWRLLFRFQGEPSAPLTSVVLSEATAVTAFRRGRGIVSLVREGRMVQFSARLIEAQVGMPVQVGDRLRVEDIDPERERLTVSILDAK